MSIPVPAELGYPTLALLIFGESAGLPIPGETALLVAGGLAASGHLSLALVIAIASAAAILGDTMGYWLGRRGGRAMLMRDGFLAAHRREAVARADRFYARYGFMTVFLARWIIGVRVVAALTAGASRMPYRRFALANATGGIAWASTVASLAAAVGPHGSLLLALGGTTFGLVFFVVVEIKRRRRRRQERPGADDAPRPLALKPRAQSGEEGAHEHV